MADSSSESNGSSPFNLNSLLAVVTLVGGLWLVSHKLTSERPVTPAGGARGFVGDQTLDARLWEDPFKRGDSDTQVAAEIDTNAGLSTIVEQIGERLELTNRVLLLPVMLSGGQYTEDEESRIRSRYAIVSALGQSGFAPEDAEHLGALVIPWPKRREIERAKLDLRINQLWNHGASLASKATGRMDVRYEWYRTRPVLHETNRLHSDVLVLWLDDSLFEDEPLLRLPLLLEPLLVTSNVDVALIGPRRSSTLRAMLPGPQFQELTNAPNRHLWNLAQPILHRIDIYSATASAMDSVLIPNATDVNSPRDLVGTEIKKAGFRSFRNFTSTDAQLAQEVIEELALDKIDLEDPQNHIVLVSEWDTFYGRNLALTYAACLTARQSKGKISAAEFVSEWTRETPMPANFHSFVYLRGLDGQTVKSADAGTESAADAAGNENTHPSSVEEIRTWTPDANKASGRGQFDYLSRLGTQLAGLRSELKLGRRGEIKAVGIVGSDVYDTLLILQALHAELSDDVVYFTTDLDARFLHPQEGEWTRELLVVSSYGLTLHPGLQGAILPFRDSAQTAQFAAALAALGNRDLKSLGAIAPRRFEIGKRETVDWSITNTPLAATDGRHPNYLHPLTRSEAYQQHPTWWPLIKPLCAMITLLLALSVIWPPLRRLSIGFEEYCREILWYTEEDVGGNSGAALLVEALRSNEKADPSCDWALQQLKEQVKKLPGRAAPGDPENQTKALLSFLNGVLSGEVLLETYADHKTHYFEKRAPSSPRSLQLLLWFPPMREVSAFHGRRQILDTCLDRLIPDCGGHSNAEVALHARRASRQIFDWRCRRLDFAWIGGCVFGIFAVVLALVIWFSTFLSASAEPFSLTSGVSAWPGEILRYVAVAASFWFSFELVYRMREMYFTLTRRFRLEIPPVETRITWEGIRHDAISLFRPKDSALPSGKVCVLGIWSRHYDNGGLRRRLIRIGLPAIALILLTGFQFDPDTLRGQVARTCDLILAQGSAVTFLLLTLLTIDSALICRRFVFALSLGPTEYPDAAFDHFSAQNGNVDRKYLDDWIDLQLIAELTERVGKLVYYPVGILVVLLFARNGWWDRWSWPHTYVLLLILYLGLVFASILILQNTARESKQKAEEGLAVKVKSLRGSLEASETKRNTTQAERLLGEIHALRRGAFVPFWKNPVVSAFFASSGGITAVQALIWLFGR